jgi:hypothetical protein
MDEKPTVYFETTIPRFLTPRPSNSLVLAGEQELTRQWWEAGNGVIPERAAADAGHIAVASRHGMDYLLTWNCRHIANAERSR